MARPRSFSHERVADRLLDTFWRHGYGRTAIPNLTAATGLLPGSLYAAFGSKEAMFRVAIERYIATIRAAVATDATGVAGVRAVLDAVVRLTVHDPERRGCLLLNAVPEAAKLSAKTRNAMEAGLREMRRLLRARLREAAAETGGRFDVERLTALCFAAAVAIRVLGRAGQDRKLLQQIADGAVAAVEAGRTETPPPAVAVR